MGSIGLYLRENIGTYRKLEGNIGIPEGKDRERSFGSFAFLVVPKWRLIKLPVFPLRSLLKAFFTTLL